jgi:hypothetical protein
LTIVSAGVDLVTKVPGVHGLLTAGLGRVVKGSTGGPDEQAREQSASFVAAIAYDADGRELTAVELSGVNGYTFTGRVMAWEAAEVAASGFKATGALGPVDAFGLERLERGVAESGLTRAS